MLVPGSPVALVLEDLGENESRETQVGYAFRLVTGSRKPVFPPTEEEIRAEAARVRKEKQKEKQKERAAAKRKAALLKKKNETAAKEPASQETTRKKTDSRSPGKPR